MEEAIKRAVERQFPELSGGYHLPRFALVQGVADAPAQSGICDNFRPRYAVDLQVLAEDGEPDPNLPILAGVPLPVPVGGDEMGFFAFPAEGTMVVVNFAYGMPSKPFIQTILPHGLSLPKVPKGDQVWQHSETAQQRVDADGNWSRQTDGRIQDFSADREVQALGNQEHYQSHTQEVDDHSTETVGGVKTIEALGAVKLLSGGSMSVAALDDLHQATGRDLNLVVGDKYNATVGGDMQERIEGLRKSVAGEGQRLVAPKNWIGSESVNLFQVVCDLLDLVQQMNTQLARHTHGPTPAPENASAFSNNAVIAQQYSAKLNPITS
ncbi:hypothetical protein [Pseudomonas kulmbachensis]|uniref:hypothetical protein n=1 Tax=Pseudomonas kulmbachensis TaxID=3043408 RepID=UPI002AAF6839|nr:hypothetical protein [Pseudomonas sp. V3/3/4/13]